MAEELADQTRSTAEELADQPKSTAETLAAGEWVFTDEQNQLRAAVRAFCADHGDETAVREAMESDPPFDAKIWRRLGSELGVFGMAVPESAGGAGGNLVDQAVAVEQLGAALTCGPLFGTVYLAIPALVAASRGAQHLEPLIEGTRTAAFVVRDDAGAFDPATVAVQAIRADQGWALSGTVERVVDAGAADVLLVAAGTPDGVGLFAVDAEASALQRIPLTTLDLTRPQATVVLTDAPAELIAGPDEAERVITHALQVGAALLAVEQVGAAQHLLDLSVDYAKNRLQFGRPIGSFQAVKHRLADDLVALEHARSTAYHAVWALTDGSDDPALAVSIAQAICSDAFVRVATDTIQVHGGIGFTWEHQAHLYYKRAYTDAALLGSAEQHRSRVAELVLDAAPEKNPPPVATGTPS
ncbi:acyl-CoA dehydrogenase family protein [Mycolicibacterium parafortuitum]|uniref:Isovaleryl-CoA dehydrogenase [Pseudonocardia dioxanivorans] n=1 Tax=Mycolicibacterium parafortuitum TaxID=39692 RepID=A0A375YEV3_MYCPF|nr:acyl-CoA dehydrogenase family protein [Mycolicibacterium parafortuitum]SRX79641.1 isovaleryl-CoA dehydrogenase [Pseudonocardia dioxanivorans] [Mycolicibacterium parafortuitum]